MTPLGERETQALPMTPEEATFPDGAALRSWVRRRTRRHRRGVWALVGDIYSVLLTLIVVVTILAPYLRRLLAAQPGSVAGSGALGGFVAAGLDSGWLGLALLMLLGAVGVGSPRPARPPLPAPPRGRLVAAHARATGQVFWSPVARVEYLIAADRGRPTVGVLPALRPEAAGSPPRLGLPCFRPGPAWCSPSSSRPRSLTAVSSHCAVFSSWRGLERAWPAWRFPSRAPCSGTRRWPSWPGC